MLKHKINFLKFKITCFEAECTYKKLMRHYTSVLKFCLKNVGKIHTPTNNSENEIMKRMLNLYNETIEELNKDMEKCKARTW